MENKQKNERDFKMEEEQKDLSNNSAQEDALEELEKLKMIEKAQLEKITKLRGQISNQEMLIEKIKRENIIIKEKSRKMIANSRESEYEMALRLSQLDVARAGGQKGLNEAEIDNLPIFSVDIDTPCCVCKKIIPQDHIVKSLPFCGHMAHQPCIDNWLISNKVCPECSTPVQEE
ncbi:hypothetical protein SteCoe_4874 [Stentor coeruleus]|uniref:RING-type domain-containing protein n=1 Tax=Stentor coeruleus TaxID=5963 RepID=A0A1R2CTX6_9CILI|nr:hypothetical protein SteCoe_4874 [Stentor coeruleus]